MDENALSELFNYIQTHYDSPPAIRAKLKMCNQAIEWAKSAGYQDWVVKLALILSQHLVDFYPPSAKSDNRGNLETISELESVWKQGESFALQGLMIVEQSDNHDTESVLLYTLVWLTAYMDNFEGAIQYLERRRNLISEKKLRYIAREFYLLGNLANARENFPMAKRCYQTSFDMLWELGDRRAMADSVDLIAMNETMRVEKLLQGEKESRIRTLSIVNSLYEVSKELRKESELAQGGGTNKTIGSVCEHLQNILDDLNSST